MKEILPISQTKLYGLDNFFNELVELNKKKKLPNKILLSGQKGVGKSTLVYHFINYVLSLNENYKYDLKNLQIDLENHSYKTVRNKTNLNFILIDIESEKKYIDINQIRTLISSLNKSSLNDKPRFVLIDNIEFLNLNSINALLKVLEEPAFNVHFFLINNDKRVLPTLISRCLNFRIFMNSQTKLDVSNRLLEVKLETIINKDLLNYYYTPGNIYNLCKFAKSNEYDLTNLTLNDFIKVVIKNNHYKKDSYIRYLLFDFIEFYFRKFETSLSLKIIDKYSYFLKKISDTKKFNLDYESLFIEFEKEILNG